MTDAERSSVDALAATLKAHLRQCDDRWADAKKAAEAAREDTRRLDGKLDAGLAEGRQRGDSIRLELAESARRIYAKIDETSIRTGGKIDKERDRSLLKWLTAISIVASLLTAVTVTLINRL